MAGEILLVDVVKQSQYRYPLILFKKIDTTTSSIAVVIAVACISSSEGTIFAIGTKDDVDCFGVVAIVKASKTALIRALIQYFYTVDCVCRKVSECDARIATEEFTTIYQDFLNLLPLGLDLASLHGDAWHFLD